MAVMQLLSTILPMAMDAMKDKGAGQQAPMTFDQIDPISLGQAGSGGVPMNQPVGGALPFVGAPLDQNRAEGGGFGLNIGGGENRGPGDTFTAKKGAPKESKVQKAITKGSKDGEAPSDEKMGAWDKAAIAASVASGLLNQGGPALPNVGFSPGAPVSNQFIV